MKKVIFALGILCFFISITASSQIIREKQAILQKPFPAISQNGSVLNDTTGDVWDEFGDLFFEKNGKTYWFPTFTQITGPTSTYYRLFELKLDSGFAREVTNEILGGYYFTGGLNPPYYYEDIDNDGIKDILIFDHGKEEEKKAGKWGSYNIFFKGTSSGFIKTEIKGITDSYQYFHAHSIGDFDNDGDLDIAYSSSKLHIFQNNGASGFSEMKINHYDSLNMYQGYQIYLNNIPYPAAGFSIKFASLSNNNTLSLLTNSSDQILKLDYDKTANLWNPSLYGQSKPFTTNPNAWLGCEQVLDIYNNNSKSTDLLFRISTYDKVPYSSNQQYFAKFFKSTNSTLISPLTVQTFDTSYAYYLDPKVADINFDGIKDIVHKDYGYGATKTPLNQRIWINDGNNQFNGSGIKFDSLLSKQMYLFVKNDSVKKYSLFMTLNENKINNNTTKVIYNRFDSLVYPTKINYSLSLCQGDTSKQLIVKVPIKINVTKQPKNGAFLITDSIIKYIPTSSGLDTISFRLKNDFFESIDYYVFYNTTPKSNTPLITRDSSNSLISSTQIKNTWYKDGVVLTDTAQKIKPTTPGSYTVKTTQNGCASVMSNPYYFIVTDIINLSKDEFIKLAPNPFVNQLNFDFVVKGYQRLNLEMFDIASGTKVASQPNLPADTKITLGHLSAGTYVIRVTSTDNKISYQFKMVKL